MALDMSIQNYERNEVNASQRKSLILQRFVPSSFPDTLFLIVHAYHSQCLIYHSSFTYHVTPFHTHKPFTSLTVASCYRPLMRECKGRQLCYSIHSNLVMLNIPITTRIQSQHMYNMARCTRYKFVSDIRKLACYLLILYFLH